MKRVFRILSYIFEENDPIDLSCRRFDCEVRYDRDGKVTYDDHFGIICRYYYDNDGRLIRKDEGPRDGHRFVHDYTYDPEGNLLHVHIERFSEYYDERDWAGNLPDGHYVDEWYSWDEKGTCTKTTEFHFDDGTSSTEKGTVHSNNDDEDVTEFEDDHDVKYLAWNAEGQWTKSTFTTGGQTFTTIRVFEYYDNELIDFTPTNPKKEPTELSDVARAKTLINFLLFIGLLFCNYLVMYAQTATDSPYYCSATLHYPSELNAIIETPSHAFWFFERTYTNHLEDTSLSFTVLVVRSDNEEATDVYKDSYDSTIKELRAKRYPVSYKFFNEEKGIWVISWTEGEWGFYKKSYLKDPGIYSWTLKWDTTDEHVRKTAKEYLEKGKIYLSW